MKNRLLALAFFASACGTDNSSTAGSIGSCPEISGPQAVIVGLQQYRYYTVPGFNPKNKACWEALRAAAKKSGTSIRGGTILVYLDVHSFTPGNSGPYDPTAKIKESVVAQVLINTSAGLFEFQPDPYQFGKYIEP